jgi:hypothetical protein
MADWNLPTDSSAYPDVPDPLIARSVDAATLCVNEPSNPIEGMIKLVRSSGSPVPVTLQERSLAARQDEIGLRWAEGRHQLSVC